MGFLVKLVLEFGTVDGLEVSNAQSLAEKGLLAVQLVQRHLQGGELRKGYCQPC